MLTALLPLLRPSEVAPPSEITLEPIDAWATDAASGGTIASSGGGTVGVFPVTIDPTPYVTGAAGSKAAWLAQFQGSTRGTWARLANGDFRFTPGSSAGIDAAEYRVSDDGGATWSAWQDITIEVCARPPGPFFAIEDYAGSNQAKVQAALNAASAVDGTAFSRNRATVWMGVNDLNPGRASTLGVKLKRAHSVHSSGDVCGQNVGSSKCSGWSGPGYWEGLFDYPFGSSNGYRAQHVLLEIDGNSSQQALRHTSGGHSDPFSPCGTCYDDGDRTSGDDVFNLQQQAGIKIRGKDEPGSASRRLLRLKRARIKNTCGDGVGLSASSDILLDDVEFIDTYRGAWVNNAGNTVVVANRCRVTREAPANHGGGIDYEPFGGGGNSRCDSTVTDCEIGEDFDTHYRDGAVASWVRCIVGPGLFWLGGGSSSCTHIDGEVRFHKSGGGEAGSDIPRERIDGRDDNIFSLTFQGTRFTAWGQAYIMHREWKTPVANDSFRIDLRNFAQLSLRFINVVCGSEHLQGTGNSVKLLRSSQSSNLSNVIRLDGVTFGAEYDLAAMVLTGQKLEYRNVVHQGFPGATIQQICPGAGQYVAI